MTLSAWACSWPTPDGNRYTLHGTEAQARDTAQKAPTPNVVFEIDVEMTVAQWVRLQFEWAFPWLRLPDEEQA